MSGHIDKYKRRLSRSGNDVGEVYKNNTIAFIEATFHASPTYRIMNVFTSQDILLTQMDARVVEIERLGSLREVLLRPNKSLEIGTYVEFDGDTWLVFDKYGGTGTTSIKLLVARCNRTIKWKDKDGLLVEWNCISSATDLGSKSKQSKNEIEWNKYDVRLPQGQLFVFVETNKQTNTIKLNNRFIFGSNVYEVVGIDDTTAVSKNGYGVIQLTVKITTKQEKDDFVNGIAFNDYTLEETTTTTDDTTSGSRLW